MHSPSRPLRHTKSPMARVITLKAKDINPESFKPYGQVIGPTPDNKPFSSGDAQLMLDCGQPRLYIMQVPERGRCFDQINYHAQVTQCLGASAPIQDWYLVVSAPTLSLEDYPSESDLSAFRIPHNVFVKLEAGTWHAGPLFDGPGMDFYNLELANTNTEDFLVHNYASHDNISFQVID